MTTNESLRCLKATKRKLFYNSLNAEDDNFTLCGVQDHFGKKQCRLLWQKVFIQKKTCLNTLCDCVNNGMKQTNKICGQKIKSSAEAENCEESRGDKSGNDGEHHHDNQHQQGGLGQHLHLADAGEEGGDEAGLEPPLARLLVVGQPLLLSHLRQQGLVRTKLVIWCQVLKWPLGPSTFVIWVSLYTVCRKLSPWNHIYWVIFQPQN